MHYIEILSERLFSYALLPPVKVMYTNPSTIKTQVIHHSSMYSTHSQCSQDKKNVQQQSQLKADGNKEQTATEKRPLTV